MDSDQFVDRLAQYVRAGFGGLLVNTHEAYDLMALLASQQPVIKAVALYIAPGLPLSLAEDMSPVPIDPNQNKLSNSTGLLNFDQWIPAVVAHLLNRLSVKVPKGSKQPYEVSATLNHVHNTLVELNMLTASDDAKLDVLAGPGGLRFVVLLQNGVNRTLIDNLASLQTLQGMSFHGRVRRTTFLLQSSQSSYGAVLDPYYTHFPFPLPNREEIGSVITNTLSEVVDATELAKKLPELTLACDGLTRRQIEDTAALLACTPDVLDPVAYRSIKIDLAESDNLFKVIPTDKRGDKLQGLNGLMNIAGPLLKNADPNNPDLRPKGLLFVGPPGSGKTAAVTQLARASGRTLCQVDIGQLRTKWVGETEERISRMFKLVESLAPSVLLID